MSFLAGASLLASLSSCSATANVADVWMSIDDDGARRRDTFYTDSAGISCLAQVGIGRRDVTVEILIRQIRSAPPGTENYARVDKVVSALDFHPEVTGGTPAVLGLKMVPTSVDPQTGKLVENADAPFGPGSYVCEVSIDGARQKTVGFNVDYAPCPAVAITPPLRCLGFYVLNDRCPASGATGAPEPSCTCQQNGWSCP